MSGLDKEFAGKFLFMTMGLPYSGKSTFVREQCDAPIVCPDAIRLALHGQRYLAEREPEVWSIAKTMVRALFLAGHGDVVLDATNTTRKRRDEWDGPWLRTIWVFPRCEKLCAERARRRKDSHILPVIDRMAKQWEPVEPDEGFTSIQEF